MRLDIEHILILIIILFGLYFVFSKCGCNNGFRIGGQRGGLVIPQDRPPDVMRADRIREPDSGRLPDQPLGDFYQTRYIVPHAGPYLNGMGLATIMGPINTRTYEGEQYNSIAELKEILPHGFPEHPMGENEPAFNYFGRSESHQKYIDRENLNCTPRLREGDLSTEWFPINYYDVHNHNTCKDAPANYFFPDPTDEDLISEEDLCNKCVVFGEQLSRPGIYEKKCEWDTSENVCKKRIKTQLKKPDEVNARKITLVANEKSALELKEARELKAARRRLAMAKNPDLGYDVLTKIMEEYNLLN